MDDDRDMFRSLTTAAAVLWLPAGRMRVIIGRRQPAGVVRFVAFVNGWPSVVAPVPGTTRRDGTR